MVELSDNELQKLIDAAMAVRDRRFCVLIRLLAETGARRGEVLERRWRDVDLDAHTIVAERTKTGIPRVLKFSSATADLIRRVWAKRDADDLLFDSLRAKGAPQSFKRHWLTITKAVGRPDLRMHDLRHQRAKKMISSGTPFALAAQALGHSSLILHRRYGHLENATIHAAVEKLWT